MNDLTTKQLDFLQSVSKKALMSFADLLNEHPDIPKAIRVMTQPDEMLETFCELAVKDSGQLRISVPAFISAMADMQTESARRAAGVER